jgi:hypothetical protein
MSGVLSVLIIFTILFLGVATAAGDLPWTSRVSSIDREELYAISITKLNTSFRAFDLWSIDGSGRPQAQDIMEVVDYCSSTRFECGYTRYGRAAVRMVNAVNQKELNLKFEDSEKCRQFEYHFVQECKMISSLQKV